MNDYLLSLILGVVEGLTEFLPVSSTAHLRITEALMHVSLSDPYWKMYTIVIQLGAILCLLVMTGLGTLTWIRFVVWFLVGVGVYAAYGYRHSRLRET